MSVVAFYEFGPFRLYPQGRQLRCGDAFIHLRPKTLNLLLFLVDNAGELLEKEIIKKEIWRDIFVDDENLKNQISVLREKLKEASPEVKYIETVPKSGYRFTARVIRYDADSVAIISPKQTVNSNASNEGVRPYLNGLHDPVADFVGRASEIEELTTVLQIQGLGVSTGISGMAGVGKTELALQVSDRLRTDYPDGQVLINLRASQVNPCSSSEALVKCILTLTATESKLPDDIDELAKRYRSALLERRILIILDDVSGSDQIRRLLPPRGSVLIVTSRNTLTLPGMKARVRLEQLNPTEAREMLTSIAQETASGIADQICQLCGYLPLAIRAAGSSLAVSADLSPANYLASLRDERSRLSRIGGEGNELEVEALLTLSCDRLEPEAARVFRRLSIFPRSFDSIAEEAVCEDPDHVQLSNLVRRSLVKYDKRSDRYTLHDLLKLVAKKHLNENEANRVALRHAQHYVRVLDRANELVEIGGNHIREGLQLFDVDSENIKAGQDWAQQRATEEERAAELCSLFPIAGSSVLELRLHPRDRIRWRSNAVAASHRLKNRKDEGKHLGYLGEAYRAIGDTKNSQKCHTAHLDIAREIGDGEGEVLALMGLGNVYDNLGEMQRGLNCFIEALTIARRIGNRKSEGKLLGNIGVVNWKLGHSEEALKYYEEHRAIAKNSGDRLGEAYTLGNLGLVSAQLGDHRRAIALNRDALLIFKEFGDRRSEGNALGNIGKSLAALGELKSSLACFKEELSIARETGGRELEAEALLGQGESQLALGNSKHAINLLREALKVSQIIQNKRIEGDVLWRMSQALYAAGDNTHAIDLAEQAQTILEQIGDPSCNAIVAFLKPFQTLQNKERPAIR